VTQAVHINSDGIITPQRALTSSALLSVTQTSHRIKSRQHPVTCDRLTYLHAVNNSSNVLLLTGRRQGRGHPDYHSPISKITGRRQGRGHLMTITPLLHDRDPEHSVRKNPQQMSLFCRAAGHPDAWSPRPAGGLSRPLLLTSREQSPLVTETVVHTHTLAHNQTICDATTDRCVPPTCLETKRCALFSSLARVETSLLRPREWDVKELHQGLPAARHSLSV
jgi:hypothetical protein